MLKIVDTIAHMRRIRKQLLKDGYDVRVVPTMGALHNGHAALISKAKLSSKNDILKSAVIVTIFVNKLQFTSDIDFDKYPKTWDADVKMCEQLQVDYIFAPTHYDMYGNNNYISERCRVEPITKLVGEMEGISRPNHFTGMLTVVNKLFNIIKPDRAFFGEKDYQQLILVDRMVEDLSMDIVIEPVATVRDDDWLPLSSRNVRLGVKQRQLAAVVNHKLFEIARKELNLGLMDLNTVDIIENHFENILNKVKENVRREYVKDNKLHEDWLHIDYLQVRTVNGFYKIDLCFKTKKISILDYSGKQVKLVGKVNVRILSAIVVDGIRLLDNIETIIQSSNEE